MPPRSRPRVLAAALLGVGMTVALAPAAAAAETQEDSRAEVRDGDVTQCEQFGGGILVSVGDGEPVQNVALSYDGGVPVQDAFLSITDVPDDIAVTAIVVKGGASHHVYVPGRSGLARSHPWTDLRAPVGSDGVVPAISHWLACGEEAPSATATTEKRSVPTEPPREDVIGESSSSATPDLPTHTAESTTTTSNTAAAPATPTTEEQPPPPAGDDDLASTGFSSGWLAVLGVALLAGGGVLLAATRARRGKVS